MNKIKYLTVISFASLMVACGGSSTNYMTSGDKPSTEVPPSDNKTPQNSLSTEETLYWIGENALSDVNSSVDLRLKTRKNGLDGKGETVDIKLYYDDNGDLAWSSPENVQTLVVPGSKGVNGKGVNGAYGFMLPVDGELTAFSISENIDTEVKNKLASIANKDNKLNFTGDVSNAVIDDNGNLVVHEGTFNLTIDAGNFDIIGTIVGNGNQARNGEQSSTFGDDGKLNIAGKVYDNHFSGKVSGMLNGKEAESDLLGQFNDGGKNITGHWNGDFSGGLTGQHVVDDQKPSEGLVNQPGVNDNGKTYLTNTFTTRDGSIKEALSGNKPLYITIADADGLEEHTVKLVGNKDSFVSESDISGIRGTAYYATENGYYGVTRFKNSKENGWLNTFNVADTTDKAVLEELRDNAIAGSKVTYKGSVHASNTLHDANGFIESKIQKGDVSINVDFHDAKLDGSFNGAPIFKDGLEFDGSFNEKGVITATGGFVGENIRDTNINGQFAGDHGEEIIGSFSSDYEKNGNTLTGGFSAMKE